MAEDNTMAEMSQGGVTQLTQVRVPLEDAAIAFAQRDATGRIPIVVVPERLSRVRNEVAVAGVLVLAAGIVATMLENNGTWVSLAIPVALVLIVLGIYRSFIVRIPEGADALLTRGGRYYKTIGSGTSIVPPWIAVSHLISQREIPFDVPIVEAPTSDNVRANVDTLITFTIADPYKFIYSISASDFDHVFQAACQDGLRSKIRTVTSIQVIDIARQDLADLHERLNQDMAAYGVDIAKIVVTYAQPPASFMSSLEAQKLASVQQEEQREQQALAQHRQANAEALKRQGVIARVEREREELQLLVQRTKMQKQMVELEAEAEALRLARLEERLKANPVAAQYEWESAQLEVARALAGNPRAFVQLGDASDISRAFMMGDLMRFGPLPDEIAAESGPGVAPKAGGGEADPAPNEPPAAN